MDQVIGSAVLAEIAPSAVLIRDDEAPELFAVWLNEDILGCGPTEIAALADAGEQLRRWDMAELGGEVVKLLKASGGLAHIDQIAEAFGVELAGALIEALEGADQIVCCEDGTVVLNGGAS